MTNQTKLLIYSILSFVLFITLIGCNANQKAATSPQKELTTYTYVITEINESGLYGDSLKDDTKIFIEYETIETLQLNESDHIAVQFPKNDWETITKVSKIN